MKILLTSSELKMAYANAQLNEAQCVANFFLAILKVTGDAKVTFRASSMGEAVVANADVNGDKVAIHSDDYIVSMTLKQLFNNWLM